MGCDVSVGDSNNHSVLRRVVFVLLLEDQTLTGIVVGSSLYLLEKKGIKFIFLLYFLLKEAGHLGSSVTSSPLEFNLKALEVSLILDYFDISLK